MADAVNDDSMQFLPGEAFENLQSLPTTEDERPIVPVNNVLPLTSSLSAIASNGESLTQTPRHQPVTDAAVGVETHTLVHSPLPLNDEDTQFQTTQSVSSLSYIAEAPSSLPTQVSISTTRALGDLSSTQLLANHESQLTVENSGTDNSSISQGVFI